MVKLSVLYPHRDGARFDIDYYVKRHMKLVADRLGPLCKGTSVDYGLGGGTPGSKPTYAAIGHVLFASAEDLQKGLGAHGAELMGDIPNFTDVQPVVQVSEVRL